MHIRTAHAHAFVLFTCDPTLSLHSQERFNATMMSLMATMNEEHPQSFVVMSSAAKWSTVLQLFMRVQVACLYPVSLLIHTDKVKVTIGGGDDDDEEGGGGAGAAGECGAADGAADSVADGVEETATLLQQTSVSAGSARPAAVPAAAAATRRKGGKKGRKQAAAAPKPPAAAQEREVSMEKFSDEMTHAVDTAFAACDADGNGALDETELAFMQARCGYTEQYTLHDLRQRLSPQGPGLVTAKGLTRQGLDFLLNMNMRQGRSDIVWRLLHGFGFAFDFHRTLTDDTEAGGGVETETSKSMSDE